MLIELEDAGHGFWHTRLGPWPNRQSADVAPLPCLIKGAASHMLRTPLAAGGQPDIAAPNARRCPMAAP